MTSLSKISPPASCIWSLVSGLLILASSLLAQHLPLSPSYWNDPAFLKAFNGSYRIEARIEPNVSSEERAALIEIQNLMANGKRSDAISKLSSDKLTADSAALTFNLANLLFENGDTEKSIESYHSALKQYPSFRRAHRNLALAFVRLNKLDLALPHLTEAIKLGDAEGSTYGLMAYCRLIRKEYASALQAYRIAQITEPEVPEWKAGIAQCLQYLDQRQEAIALLEEVINQRPTEASYAILKANIHIDLQQPDLATKALELPHRLNILDPNSSLLLADLHLRALRKPAALSAISSAFANPASLPAPTYLLRLISTASSQNDWELVKQLLQKTDPASTDPEILLARAKYLIDSDLNPTEGTSILETIIKQNPTHGQALLALAKHLSKTRQPDAAELFLERATTDPTSAHEAYIELARLYINSSRYSDAIKAIDSALALNPSESLQTYRQSLLQTISASE